MGWCQALPPPLLLLMMMMVFYATGLILCKIGAARPEDEWHVCLSVIVLE